MMIEHDFPLLQRITGRAAQGGAGNGKAKLITAYVEQTIAHAEPTPIVEVSVLLDGHQRTILLKLEGRSRWGSIKGRTGLALMASIAHEVEDDSRVVESTSGNLGVALAGICRELDVAFTAVVDARLPPSMRSQLARLGAQVVEIGHTADGRYLQQRIALVQEILRENKHALWTNQYENPANVTVHRWWTGPELGRQLPAQAEVVFSPVSTGGSFTGLRQYLAAERPSVECVAVDVHGSTIFGGAPGHRLITGIGASKPSRFISESGMPRHVMVTDAEAIATCRFLAQDTGIAIGGSSGAVLAGCLRFLLERPQLDHAVCMCPDMASNYRQTLYNDEWLASASMAQALDRPAVGGQPMYFTSTAAGASPGCPGRSLPRHAEPVLPRN